MQVSLVTPADKRSRSGNRTTASRWAGILRRLGHRVRVAVAYEGEPADLLIALHAWRSAASIMRFRERHPEQPIVVGLAGTDIYRFLASDPETVIRSLELADALVGLHRLAAEAIPERFREKLTVIHQSAEPVRQRGNSPPGLVAADPSSPARRSFAVLVIANLRDEKDPLRAAEAARLLPASSRIRVMHLGRTYAAEWAERAIAEMASNARYRWRGEVPFAAVRRALARADLLVSSSLLEGGANAVSEAVVAGVPVLASEIPGSVGLLGADYPGYFPVGDTQALAGLMLRAERDSYFLAELGRHCAARTALFHPEREREAWRALLARLCHEGDRLRRIAPRQDGADDRRARIARCLQSD